ncbi:unnamed protein product [Cylindrotheca closterium]|uniref:Uncharacterized protein n=1 Tax=Cylindrotheca closterium TaxID=2856 RepID=A0AAD2CDQ7_9STRA|nr:unnamed protein product [Cylindrotheca closterium]
MTSKNDGNVVLDRQNNNIQGGVVISSPDAHVPLPNLKYGYRKERYRWEELKAIIHDEQDLDKLSRSENDQREYEVFRYHLKQQYSSIVDYILITKFGFEKAKNDTGLWRSIPSLQESKIPRKTLVKNDFPYYTAPNIIHYILWKIKEDLTPTEIEQADTELKTSYGALDVVEWTNPPHLKSLPEIDHAHFLCLIKE